MKTNHQPPQQPAKVPSVKSRLAYLRREIIAERISYGEIHELTSLAKHIDPSDVLLLEWAGVPESGSGRRNQIPS